VLVTATESTDGSCAATIVCFIFNALFKPLLMFLQRKISLRVILQFAWKVQLYSFIIGLFVFIVYELFDVKSIAIPFLPVATIGTAVAFYVGFKNNSAYDRLWEARRIWGSITNASRMWASTVMSVVGSRQNDMNSITKVKKELLYRHLAWVNMLRLQLRRNPVFSEPAYVSSAQLDIIRKTYGQQNFEQEAAKVYEQFLSVQDKEAAMHKFNVASYLMSQQNETLIACKNRGWLDEFEHTEMSRLVLEFYNQQGAAERIKSFPFPRQYANFSLVFVYIFITLLPFAMINDLDKLGHHTSWLVIPFTMLIAWVFNVMEQVGDASENPFDNGINDVPMTAICRNIEIEFRELLGEKELPARIQPINGILM
jgi:ion channel-forming bestrophin family protein